MQREVDKSSENFEANDLEASTPPMNPDDLLTPALSSFWGGEGDGSRLLQNLAQKTQ
jgi:hypothetical protein